MPYQLASGYSLLWLTESESEDKFFGELLCCLLERLLMTPREAESAKCIAFVAFLVGPNVIAVIFVVFIAIVIV